MNKKNLSPLLCCLSVISALATLFLMVACAKPAPTSAPSPTPAFPKELDIATFPLGSSTHVVATGWAKIIGQYLPMVVSVKPMAGPGVYMPMVDAGEVSIGVDVSPTVGRMWRLEGEFKDQKKMSNLRSLFIMAYQEAAPFLVRKDSSINTAKDVKGKKVASEYGANVNVVNHVTVGLLSAGLSWKDVIAVPVSSSTAAYDALREGRVDTCIALGATHPGTVELDAAIGIRFVGDDKNPEEIPEFQQLLRGATGVRMKPAGALKSEIWGHHFGFWYVASTHLSDQAAYQIVKTIWEHPTEIRAVHSSVNDFTSESMLGEPVLPLHEGAIRFYKEKGVWTDKMQRAQDELLKLK